MEDIAVRLTGEEEVHPEDRDDAHYSEEDVGAVADVENHVRDGSGDNHIPAPLHR